MTKSVHIYTKLNHWKLVTLQAESPSCIWGRSVCSPDGNGEISRQYCNLTTKINLFYQDVTRDHSKLKPAKLEQGEVRPRTQRQILHRQPFSSSLEWFNVCVAIFAWQVCVVYSSEKRSWCRAQVESVSTDSVSCRAYCFLVDHGERVFVSSDE